MSTDPHGFFFKVSANLLRIIGEELVASDEVALLELVKNAYDSNAHAVTITIELRSEKRVGFITIEDDGHGMSRKDFERLFMVAGYSERPEEAQTAERVPTGEKGIGRFAASRLGSRLTVLTRALAHESKALQVKFDWKKFQDKTKKFDEVLIPYEYVTTNRLPRGKTGTVLEITGVSSDWKPDQIKRLREVLGELLDPFQKSADFKINLSVVGSERLSGPIGQVAPEGADLELDFRVLADGQISRKLTKASFSSDNPRELVSSGTSMEPLAGLTGRFLYFLKRPTKTQSQGLAPAVRIYRDGVRVEPFGSAASDWLGLTQKRAKRAGHAHIVPSRLYGFVETSRIKHQELKDTTSRQALIDNEAAQALVTLLREQLNFVEERVRTRVSEPRWEAGKRKKAIKLERARLHALGMLSAGLSHELRQPLQVIRTQAGNIKDRLSELGVDDREIRESNDAIDRSIERIDQSIEYIAGLAKGDVEEVEEFDLAELVRSECVFFEHQCKAKGIELVSDVPPSQVTRISRTGFSMVLLNLYLNAADALDEQADENEKRITITLSKDPNANYLEVSDNGPGIADEMRENLFKEFETGKTGGMGIGLYNCKLIVGAHGGDITYDTRAGKGTTFRVRLPNR